MDKERAIYNKRSFIGYDPKGVREYILNLQEEQKRELEFLKQKVQKEKEKNESLRMDLNRHNQLPKSNPIAEQLTDMFMKLFVQHNESILNLKNELLEQENNLSEQLENKNKQLVSAQVKVQDALEYLRTIPIKLSESKKELSK